MTLYSRDGLVTEQMVGYYAARAKGGVGAIVTELGPVHPASIKFIETLRPWEDHIVPGLDKLGAAVHEHGAHAIMQFAGGGSRMNSLDSRMPLWGVSDTPSSNYDEVPHRMTTEQVDEVIHFTSLSAANVARSQMDGIEFHLAHGYLAGQFVSRRHNDRTDKYGGAALRERLTFTRESLEAIKTSLRSDQIVGVKMNASDYDPAGTSQDEWIEVADIVASWGLVDYFTVSAGTAESEEYVVPPTPAPLGLNVDVARLVKKSTGLPTYVVGRIQDPQFAADLIARGDVDGVAMARGLIADPEWASKAQAGDAERIRPCIGANQGCVGNLHRSRPVTCTVNPSAGLEYLAIAAKPKPDRRGNVIVVGGGPAGLQAALSALQLGREVTLIDEADELGGAVLDAALPASRRQLLELIEYLRDELSLQNRLTLELGHRVESLEGLTSGAEAAIVATGARRTVPQQYLNLAPSAVTAQSVLRSNNPHDGRHAIVVDDVGTMEAYGVAEYLATSGAQVDLVTTRASIGWHLDTATNNATNTRLRALGIRVHTQTGLNIATSESLQLVRAAADSMIEIPYDELVVAAPAIADDTLLGTVSLDFGGKLLAIGDCLAPRSITEAVREGSHVSELLLALHDSARLEMSR